MTKLIIQIPCLNEAETLPATLAALPKAIDGVSEIEVLIIDDGSTDDTAAVARAHGAHHVISNVVNRGLAYSFQRGLEECLRRGADIIVNTDGDNQYAGEDIAVLVGPVLRGEADIVVGDRQTDLIDHFSPLKKSLQRIGSRVVSGLAGAPVADAVSGFRALSRRAACGVFVRSNFSYTTETLIQAGRKRLKIVSAPIKTNKVERPSRLFRSIPHFLSRTGQTMLRAYAMYQPLKIFLAAGVVLTAIGALPVLRFVAAFLAGNGDGKVQSLVIGAIFIMTGGMSIMFALVADLVAFNRQLLEETLERVRRLEYAQGAPQAAGAERPALPTDRIREELAQMKHSPAVPARRDIA